MAAFLAITGFVLLFPTGPFPSIPDSIFVEEFAFGSFEAANRILVDPQGRIFVLDAGKNTVLRFTDPAEKPATIGGYGWLPSSFDTPSGVTTDGLNVYVADYGNHRIQRFDRNLNYISFLATRDTSESSLRFGYPTGIALSRQGDLFILDSENLRVLKVTSGTRFEKSFGEINARQGKLYNPIKIVVTENGRIFVAEPDRILEFDYFGNYVSAIGSGILAGVRGFDASDNGLIVVSADTLFLFAHDGRVTSRHSRATIITQVPLDQLEDVAASEGKIFLLTTRKVYVFRISS